MLAVVTKFSRYNESSDSDESDTDDTSDSESSSTDDGHLASPRPVSPSGDSPNDDVLSTNNRNNSGSGVTSTSIDEHSSMQQSIDAKTLTLTEQTDLPTDDAGSHRSSVSHKSDNSSLSSVGSPPSQIHTPLQLESTGQSSLMQREHRKGVPTNRRREQMTARRSPLRNYESSPSCSRHSLQTDIRNERLPLQTSNSSRSHPVKSYASASDLKPLSAVVSEQLSPRRQPSAASGDEYRLRSRSRERSSDVLSSYTSERRPASPPRFQKDDLMHSQSRSQSPSVGKSAHQQRSRSTEKDLRRSLRSRSSSRSYCRSSSKSRSRSRERFVDSSTVQSVSNSRSQLPVQRSSYRRRTRSRSASHTDEHFARRLDSEVASRSPSKSPSRYPPADPCKRQTLRSCFTDRMLQMRGPQDVESHKSVESSPCRRSFSRSPDHRAQAIDPKPVSYRKIVESPVSSSQSSSHHGSPVPRLSDQKSHGRQLSPGQCEKNRPKDDRKDSDRYAAAKPEGHISRRLQPEMGDRLSPLTSSVGKRNLASRRKSPDNRLSVQRGRIHDRLGQRINDVTHSRVRKRYSPSLQESASAEKRTSSQYDTERHHMDRLTEKMPVSSVYKLPVKVKVDRSRWEESYSKYKQNLTGLQSKHQRMSPDKSEDSSVVEKLKKLAEPDKIIHENEDAVSTSGDKSPHQEHSHLRTTRTLPSKSEPESVEPEKANARKALSLKRPTAPATSVLEARKRRFEQTQDADSRSVCIRSSSVAETVSGVKVRKHLSAIQYDKSKQLSRKEAVTADVNDDHDNTEDSGVDKTYGKMQMDVSVSDISEPSSAESSMSLENISEDETPQPRDKHFVERSDFSSSPQPPADGSKVQKKRQRNNSEDIMSNSKPSAVSSIVRPVKGHTAGVPKARRSVQTVTQLASEAQSIDDSSTADGGIAVRAAVKNIGKG